LRSGIIHKSRLILLLKGREVVEGKGKLEEGQKIKRSPCELLFPNIL